LAFGHSHADQSFYIGYALSYGPPQYSTIIGIQQDAGATGYSGNDHTIQGWL